MNQGRIWCVVNPTVGLPLFIGGVAVTSLVVHASVMTHTTWMSNYWQGAAAKTASADTTIAPVASNVMKTGDGYVITVKVTPGCGDKLSSLESWPPTDSMARPFRAVTATISAGVVRRHCLRDGVTVAIGARSCGVSARFAPLTYR